MGDLLLALLSAGLQLRSSSEEVDPDARLLRPAGAGLGIGGRSAFAGTFEHFLNRITFLPRPIAGDDSPYARPGKHFLAVRAIRS
jgi:hypothetical protein